MVLQSSVRTRQLASPRVSDPRQQDRSPKVFCDLVLGYFCNILLVTQVSPNSVWAGNTQGRESKRRESGAPLEAGCHIIQHEGADFTFQNGVCFNTVFHIFLIYLFIYLFIYLIYLFLAALRLRCYAWALSSCGERGPLFPEVRVPLIAVASPAAEHRL